MLGAKYPLLIEGFALPNVAAGATNTGSGLFTKNQGRVIGLDYIPTIAPGVAPGRVTITVGGDKVIDEDSIPAFDVSAFPRSSRVIPVNAGGGQTWAVTVNAALSTVPISSQFLAFYERPENSLNWLEPWTAKQGGLKIQTALINAIAAGATGTLEGVIPTGRGPVCGIQIISPNGTFIDAAISRVSLTVGNKQVIKTVTLALGQPEAARPGLIMPLMIPEGESFEITILNNSANTINGGIRFYFS